MNKKIPARRKWVMATGLTLVFLPLGVYVNSDDLSAAALMQRLFPDLTIQFVVSTAITFAWISMAEWTQKFLQRFWGTLKTGPRP